MTNSPVADFNLGRRGTRTVLRPVTAAGIAKRYLTRRERALRYTHQSGLLDFIGKHQARFETLDDAVLDYFRQFKLASDVAHQRWQKRIDAIQNDANMTSVDKHREIQKIREPMAPAWTQELEDGFVFDHGQPRASMAAWNSEVEKLHLESYEIHMGLDMVQYIKSNWERQVARLLEYSELDGSVAPVMTMTTAEHAKYRKSQGMAEPEIPEIQQVFGAGGRRMADVDEENDPDIVGDGAGGEGPLPEIGDAPAKVAVAAKS